MNIALFGGTFDPVHTGHLEAAKAAAGKFQLDQVLFIPAGNPPHKRGDHFTSFPHRFAMVALACAEDRRFVPSLLESPTPDGRPQYSIATARKAKTVFGPKAHLYFLIGVDAFLDLPHWKDYRRLLDLVDFIVVSRPGSSNDKIPKVVPEELLRPSQPEDQPDTVPLKRTTLSILRGVEAPVASRDIREAIRAGQGVSGLVPPLVEQYILKAGLYAPRRGRRYLRR